MIVWDYEMERRSNGVLSLPDWMGTAFLTVLLWTKAIECKGSILCAFADRSMGGQIFRTC